MARRIFISLLVCGLLQSVCYGIENNPPENPIVTNCSYVTVTSSLGIGTMYIANSTASNLGTKGGYLCSVGSSNIRADLYMDNGTNYVVTLYTFDEDARVSQDGYYLDNYYRFTPVYSNVTNLDIINTTNPLGDFGIYAIIILLGGVLVCLLSKSRY